MFVSFCIDPWASCRHSRSNHRFFANMSKIDDSNMSTSLPATPEKQSVQSKPAKRGRKPKSERKPDETVLRWTLDMVKYLMEEKFVTFNEYFNSKSNNKKKAEGWMKVQLSLRKKFKKDITVEQVKSKYQNLNKKWRDNSSRGKETTKTGNEPVDPNNCKDEEFDAVSSYFSMLPGCGIDLGQATDVANNQESDWNCEDDDHADDLDNDEDFFSPSQKRSKVAASSPMTVIGEKMETAFDKVSGSITNLADAMLQKVNTSDQLPDLKNLLSQQQLMLQQIAKNGNEMKEIAKEQKAFMQAIGQSMQMTATLQASMLDQLSKLSKK